MKDQKPQMHWTASDGNSFQADAYLNHTDKTVTFKLFDCGLTEMITTSYADFLNGASQQHFNSYLGPKVLKEILNIIKEKI